MTPPPDAEGQPHKELSNALKPLAAKIVELQDKMKAAGMFIEDRDLLECPQCGLQEDVTSDGFLITCPKESPGEDIGETFMALDNRESCWRCPKCGAEFLSEGFTE